MYDRLVYLDLLGRTELSTFLIQRFHDTKQCSSREIV